MESTWNAPHSGLRLQSGQHAAASAVSFMMQGLVLNLPQFLRREPSTQLPSVRAPHSAGSSAQVGAGLQGGSSSTCCLGCELGEHSNLGMHWSVALFGS